VLPPLPIDDPRDPRLRDYTDLTDVALRRVREPAEGLFLAEGEKVVRRALAAGYAPRSFLLDPRRVEALSDVLADTDAPVYVAGQEVLAAVTGYRVHRGVLASLHRRPLPSVADVLAPARRVVVCEELVDHTNVGAVFRSAAALGVDGVLVTPRCADPLYRRSVRVSMGAVLQVPWARLETWPAGVAQLREAGFTTAALAPGEESVTLDALADRDVPRLALVLGTEGDGLRPSTLAATDLTVHIPMAGDVDSLNVAAAAAVAVYATRPR
jgi:tRNA G18 (ribose-2'-O)-methylase SpoU